MKRDEAVGKARELLTYAFQEWQEAYPVSEEDMEEALLDRIDFLTEQIVQLNAQRILDENARLDREKESN